MADWLQTVLVVFGTVIASSGFWAYMQRKDAKRTHIDKLLQGLAYKEIISMGMDYIQRGWITEDEYADYRTLLYDPYKALGGNGVTERVVAEVSNLPIRSRYRYAEILKEAKIRGEENERYEEVDAAVLNK